jgi:hypothetical protein
MKKFKMLAMSLAVVLVLSAIAGVAMAQGPVDENDDGVCDVCGEQVGDGLMIGPRNWQGVDADGDGVCDDFVDEDGDGLCDNEGLYAERSFGGRSSGYRTNLVDENGDGVCDSFVDEDGDGVCDDCGMAYTGEQLGPRYGQNDGAYGEGYRANMVDENGDGVCDDFVDEDGDGLCDNDGQYAQRSISGRGGMGGRGNWNQSQDQGLWGQNRQ